jgi:hypothetical protein
MATQLVNPKIQFDDDNGDPCSGCQVFFYETGTATKQDTFTDAGGGTPNANPVVLDSAGQASIWLNEGDQYRVILAPSSDSDPPVSPIWTVDNIDSIMTLTIATDSIFLVQHTAAGLHSYRLLSEFDDLADAVSEIGATNTELWGDASDSSSATVPDNISFRPIIGNIMSGTVTWNCPIVGEPTFQWLSGTGHTLKNVVVDWYGAVGDDSTDNLTAINNAIASLSNGGQVEFYSGVYQVSDQLTLISDITLVNSGRSEIKQVGDNKLLFYGDAVSNVTFDGLILRGGGDSDSASMLNTDQYSALSQSRGITIEVTSLPSTPGDVSNITVKNCRMIDFKNYAITIAYPVVAKVINNYITGTDPDPLVYTPTVNYQQMGIQIYTPAGVANFPTTEGQITIQGNTIEKTIHGIYISPGYTDVVIDDNVISTTMQHCIYDNAWQNHTISNNVLRPYLSGIKVQTSAATYGSIESVVIDGNSMYGNPGLTWGIVIDDIEGTTGEHKFNTITVTGNTIKDFITTGGGMFLSNIINGVVTGNSIYNTDETGIRTNVFGGIIANNLIRYSSDAGIELIPGVYDEIVFKDNHCMDLSYGAAAAMVSAQDAADPDSWTTSTAYGVGVYVTADSGTNVYICTQNGVSASEPTGTGSDISDGTCVWDFVSTLASVDRGTIVFDGNVITNAGGGSATASLNVTDSDLKVYATNNICPMDVKSYIVPAALQQESNNRWPVNAATLPTYDNDLPFGMGGRDFHGTGFPTTGRYRRTDRVWDTTPSSGGDIGWSCVISLSTALNGGEPSGETSMVVDDGSSVVDGDKIGVVQDDGTTNWTTVASGGGTNTLVLTSGLTDDAADGNAVYTERWKPFGPID